MAIVSLSVGTEPIQVPVSIVGSTVINNSQQIIIFGNDQYLQHDTVSLQPGSSLFLPPPGPYWSATTAPTTIEVLPGQAHFFTSSSNVANDVLVQNTSPIPTEVSNSAPIPISAVSTKLGLSFADSVAPADQPGVSQSAFVAGFTPIFSPFNNSVIMRSASFTQDGSTAGLVGLSTTANTAQLFRVGSATANRPWEDFGTGLWIPAGSALYFWCSVAVTGYFTYALTNL